MPPIAKSAVLAALAVVALLACCCLWFAQIALADDVHVHAPPVQQHAPSGVPPHPSYVLR